VVWRVVGTGTPQNAPGGGPGAATSAESIEHVGRVMEAARTRIANQEIAQAEKILAAGGEQFPAEQQVFLLWGEMLALQGRIPEALDAYERAIALGPDHAEYRHVAGTIAAQLGRLEDADAHYAMAQKLNPNNPKHPLYRAQIQRKLGDTDGARANLVASTNLDPTIPVAWAGLAGIALDKNRSQVALAHIRKARALDPHTLAWRVVEAKALRRMGKPEEAANLMLAVEKEDLAIEPSAVAEVALSLGLLGKHADAAGLYVLAVEANPGDVVVLFEAATWLDRAGETERALEYAEIAAGMGHEGAKRLIDARAVADGGDG
jgi:tetratricopeptide (TPR) repeat protein